MRVPRRELGISVLAAVVVVPRIEGLSTDGPEGGNAETIQSLHEERPDLVDTYTDSLEAQWGKHQALGEQFTRSGESPLTPEQIRALRSLGYLG